MSFSTFKEDAPISHGDGIKSFWRNMFKWSGFATKQEYLHGFLFNLYIGMIIAVIFFSSVISILLKFIMTSSNRNHVFSNSDLSTLLSVLVFSLILLILCIPFAIAGYSLLIRRLRAAGVETGWIAGVILAPIALSCVPFFGWLFTCALQICTWIVCFARPSIANRGYVYSFIDVLTNSYSSPKANPRYQQYTDHEQTQTATHSTQSGAQTSVETDAAASSEFAHQPVVTPESVQPVSSAQSVQTLDVSVPSEQPDYTQPGYVPPAPSSSSFVQVDTNSASDSDSSAVSNQ